VCVCVSVYGRIIIEMFGKNFALPSGLEKWKSVGVGGNLKPKHAAAAEKLAM